MIITTPICLEQAFAKVAEFRDCYCPDGINYELHTSDDIAMMTSDELVELGKRLPNFFYQRDIGLIRFFNIGVHEHAATALLAYHYDISYNAAFNMSEDRREHHNSTLMYMYNSVDMWLNLGNRAFFSGVSMGRIYAKRGTLNSDETDMFEYDFGYKMEWLD